MENWEVEYENFISNRIGYDTIVIIDSKELKEFIKRLLKKNNHKNKKNEEKNN